jgi:hypothetical protein
VGRARLRELNGVFEEKIWGAFRTELCPTYDFKPVWDQFQAGRRAKKSA